MVDEFSAFARMPKPTKQLTDLREILTDAVFLREIGSSEIEFQRDFGDDLWKEASMRGCWPRPSATSSRTR